MKSFKANFSEAWKLFIKNLDFILKFCYVATIIFVALFMILVTVPSPLNNTIFIFMEIMFGIFMAGVMMYASYKNLASYGKKAWQAGLKLWLSWIILFAPVFFVFILTELAQNFSKIHSPENFLEIYIIGITGGLIIGFCQFLGSIFTSLKH